MTRRGGSPLYLDTGIFPPRSLTASWGRGERCPGDGDGQGLRIREAKHAAPRAAGQDVFPGQGSCGVVSILDADRIMSARDDELRIGCDRPREVLVSETERGSPFGQVVAPNNFGR